MSHELPKAYNPGAIELRWAEYWVAEKLFHVNTPESAENVFDLLLPPPNVTGRLHMGHMLNQTEMDIIIRWKRMSGFTTLWLPGTDHAGIATQMMVERQLATEGKKRQELGREKFIERVWEWKGHYGGAILDQMKRLGASVDWDREYFTMDENLSRAVREVFVRLYEQGLIYRGNYIVNWCPRCVTAISDLEVVHEETQGKLYEIKYPIVGSKDSITVATTRPETMLGDTAVAVNPNDERYKHLIGRVAKLPLMDREIPIIADDWANPEFGTGAVKVTPAHDPNDFAIGQRHHLPQINIMDEYARMNENAGPYAGLDRFAARTKIVEDLEAQHLLVRVKDHMLSIGKCDRCKTIVEPRLSTQWFVKIAPLAKRAIEVVDKGYIKFTPDNYKTIYLNWMNNIYDWCISRQLWWGHRIPAWHCADCKQHSVARSTPTKCAHCGSANIEQDTDVLDTWFSSALLPFTTFGWPEKTQDLEVFYPTSLLITGFDILFFWVARMIMMGTWFMGDEDKLDTTTPEGQKKLAESVPFREVYIHALVRDADRQKMSKTKGNVLDPIEIIERFGTDAVRFTLASMAAPGPDIAYNEDRTEGYRAFANKIWNAARFIFMNVDRAQESGAWSLSQFDASATPKPSTLEDRWILSRFHSVTQQVDESLNNYRFDEAANAIYRFFWNEFCDWYIEIVKLRLNAGDSDTDKATTRAALDFTLHIFEGSLRLLSPFMPFITEEIWNAIYDGKPPKKSIALALYPKPSAETVSDDAAEEEMSLLQALIVDVRTIRAEMKIENKQKTPIEVHASNGNRIERVFQANLNSIHKLANVEQVAFTASSLSNAAGARVSPNYEVRVVYEQKIDVAAERERLTKELKKLETEMANAQRQLSNEQFMAKAPEKVVEGIKRRSGELAGLIEKIQRALADLDDHG
ncbi:MAG: valyl-tRNA synthetase [Acidobacteriaceae bacterium]|nr:valyl-tRNA synthetase [Acidobacteriaceae bacterium]